MLQLEKQQQKIMRAKNNILTQEITLKNKERKLRTSSLIEMGLLAATAKIDSMPKDIFYGAMLYLKELLAKNDAILENWQQNGSIALENEAKQQKKSLVTVKPNYEQYQAVRSILQEYKFKYDSIRREWSGYVAAIEMEKFKSELTKLGLNIEGTNGK